MSSLVSTSTSRFGTIRPELLGDMQVLEELDSEELITDRMTKLAELWSSYDPPNAAAYDVNTTEFDPLKIQAELAAYFELLLRDRINQAAKAVTLAFASGTDLDAIGSRYPYGCPRLTKTAGTWTGSGAQESDDAYRQRIWLSPSVLSLSGSGQGTYQSYVFWALSCPMPTGKSALKHASALTVPGTGVVTIPILPLSTLSSTWVVRPTDLHTHVLTPGADPQPSTAQVLAVHAYLSDDAYARKGLTDVVNVTAPQVYDTAINVQVWLLPGVDTTTAMGEVCDAVSDLIAATNWLGADLTLLALNGALMQAGVYNVVITSPTADVIVGMDGVVNVTTATITHKGTGE